MANIMQPNQNPTTPAQTPRKKVLIIEDEKEISEVYQQILTEAGYSVTTAINGKDGLQKVFEYSPDVIILDIRMPVMDGKTMFSTLRNDPAYVKFKNVPVVILTNSESYESIRDTKTEGGASEYIIKSNIAPNEIVDIVNRNLS
jgi:CheY-like chemotaxis protein